MRRPLKQFVVDSTAFILFPSEGVPQCRIHIVVPRELAKECVACRPAEKVGARTQLNRDGCAQVTLLIIGTARPDVLPSWTGRRARHKTKQILVVEELIPETVRSGTPDVATVGFVGGFAVMMALDNALG